MKKIRIASGPVIVLGLLVLSLPVNASTYTATLQPVELCQFDGSSCQTSIFDRSSFESLFTPVGITFDYLPVIQLNAISTTANPDGYASFQDQAEAIGLLRDPVPSGVPADVLVHYFGQRDSTFPVGGLSTIGGSTSLSATAFSPSSAPASLLAREIGWSLMFGLIKQEILSLDPLNLFCDFSVTACQTSDPEYGRLNEVQIAAMQSSPFVTPSPIPIPAAAWLFGTGLICLIGFARRKKATL